MGCGCGAKNQKTRRYAIDGDPENKHYLTERDAEQGKTTRKLTGKVVAVLV